MFREILYTHVRWTRAMVASMAVLTFLTPALAWFFGAARVWDPSNPQAVRLGFQTVGPVLTIIAILGSFLLAAYPWTLDAAAKHVLPLSLPVTWRRYVAMRFGAGAMLLAIPTVTLWLGSLLALSMMTLPPTLRAYPHALALRFLAGCLLVYALAFFLQYVTGRRSTMILLGLMVGGSVLLFALQVTGNGGLVSLAVEWLTKFPGPLAVFSAEWKLVDV
jgi:hypothetical protein